MQCKERIRALRENHSLSQRKVAGVINVSQHTYCDYESGRLRIPLDKLILLAKYYDCCMDYISGASNVRRSFPEQ
ncbi:MAG: helix-turn-helix transcriptional regulator [Eubacteriales bacterium]|nr:helix-turn-helix transcriptional regulator [Eubacteriales bacterium]